MGWPGTAIAYAVFIPVYAILTACVVGAIVRRNPSAVRIALAFTLVFCLRA